MISSMTTAVANATISKNPISKVFIKALIAQGFLSEKVRMFN